MITHAGPRPPTLIGTVPIHGPTSRPDSMLVLDDGSVWRGWDAPADSVLSGAVTLRGDRVFLDGTASITLRAADLAAFAGHIRSADGMSGLSRGCVTPAGAVGPVHVAVARAVARGEIGRP